MKDEVLTELWKIKDSIAKENNHDVGTLMMHLKKVQATSGRKTINRYQNIKKLPVRRSAHRKHVLD